MQELLIVNPSRRPSKRRKSTKAASPAQKRARAAFAAMARARGGKKRKTAKRRKSSSSVASFMHNPIRRKRKTSTRRRRNPIAGVSMLKKPMALITPALLGAAGAAAVNTILSKLPIPAAAMTGRMRYLTQAGAAIALAAIASKLGVKGTMAAQMAEGSLTVTLHQAIVDLASGAGVNLSGIGYYLPGAGVRAVPGRGSAPAQMAMNGMGKYISGPGSGNSMAMAGMRRKTSGFGF